MRKKGFYLILFFFILGVILIMVIMISSVNFDIKKLLDEDREYMASYIDGEYQNEIPGKDDGYVVDKIVCDNGATATWNNEEWGINIRNATQKVKCSLYFRLKNDVTITYDNNYVVNNIFEKKYDTTKILPNHTTATTLNINLTINNEGFETKSYVFSAPAYSEPSWAGCYFNAIEKLEANKTYYYAFEVRGSGNFTATINSEQDAYTFYNINNSWKKYNRKMTAQSNGPSAFVFYNWLSTSESRTLEIRNLELQEGEYDNYSTISLKETDKLSDTLPTPTRENYTFLGWYTDPIEGDKISGDTVVTKNTTYYAHWQYSEN